MTASDGSGVRGTPDVAGGTDRLAVRVVPCLDVTGGRVVKGVNFVDLRDAGDPVELAALYDREGADELVFLDITASSDGRETMVDLVARVAEEASIPFAVGGGVRSVGDVRTMLRAGADKVALNTAAIHRPGLLADAADAVGSQSVVVAVDARRRDPGDPRAGWTVTSHGGRRESGLDAVEWCFSATEAGAGEILLTSMDRDGTRSGFDLELLSEVTRNVRVPVIASGGAGTAAHLVEAVVRGGASAVLAASIFHFGELRVSEVKQVLAEAGVTVRSNPPDDPSGAVPEASSGGRR